MWDTQITMWDVLRLTDSHILVLSHLPRFTARQNHELCGFCCHRAHIFGHNATNSCTTALKHISYCLL